MELALSVSVPPEESAATIDGCSDSNWRTSAEENQSEEEEDVGKVIVVPSDDV